MKHIVLALINNDKSCNKSATRYLYKTHPDLWYSILKITSFLPDTAKPKQRVWHIINQVYERPKCPITGEYLSWYENRYFIASSASARTTLLNRSGKLNNHTPAANEKRRISNIKVIQNGRKPRSQASEREKQNRKSTVLKKYGVSNPSKHSSIRKKISDSAVKNGATPVPLRKLRDIYYARVKQVTKENWIQNFDIINPHHLNRGDWHLDHVFSQQEGFRNNIPPYIIGHWTNLRLITPTENILKGMKCSKSKDQLFEDFFNSHSLDITLF